MARMRDTKGVKGECGEDPICNTTYALFLTLYFADLLNHHYLLGFLSWNLSLAIFATSRWLGE